VLRACGGSGLTLIGQERHEPARWHLIGRTGFRRVRADLSGAETTFNAIAGEIERLTGTTLTRNVLGSAEDLRAIVDNADDPWSVVMQWYLLSMLTLGPFPTNDNDRYPEVCPTGLHDYLAAAHRHHRTLPAS
jgi:hypothetical protein